MRRVRRREDGPKNYYNHARGIRITEDDPEADVDDADAAYLVDEHGGFEYVDGAGGDAPPEGDADEKLERLLAEAEGDVDADAESEPIDGDPTNYTIAEFEDLLAGAGFADSVLDDMADAERAGKDRTGIYDAIDAHREA